MRTAADQQVTHTPLATDANRPAAGAARAMGSGATASSWCPVVLFAEGQRRLAPVGDRDKAFEAAGLACLADPTSVGYTIELEI